MVLEINKTSFIQNIFYKQYTVKSKMAIVHTRNVRNRKKGSKSIEKYINLAVSTIKKSVSSPSDLISFISDLLFNPSYSI